MDVKSINNVIDVFRRKWFYIVIFIILSLSIAFYYNWVAEPIYQATTRLFLGETSTKSYLPDNVESEEASFIDDVGIETYLSLLKSEFIINKVVENFYGETDLSNSDAYYEKVKLMKKRIDIFREPNTRIFKVNVEMEDPALAQSIANFIAKTYISLILDRKKEALKRSMDWLSGQLKELEKKAENQEKQLVEYIQKEGVPAFSLETEDNESQTKLLQELHAELVRAELIKEQLLQKYLPKHPKVQAINKEILSIKKQIGRETGRLIHQKEKSIKYQIIKDKAQTEKQLFASLMEKLGEVELLRHIGESDVQVIEHASLPIKPVKPRKLNNLALSLLVGLLVGGSIALIRDAFDRTVQSPEEVQEIFDSSILGTIPKLEYIKEDKCLIYSNSSLESENFRMLINSIENEISKNNNLSDKTYVLLVTSSLPEEGKSFFSSNLAKFMAENFKKTLLIDADIRKPTLHNTFDIPHRAGFTTYLIQNVDLSEIIKKTKVPNLDFLPSGRVPANPAQVIISKEVGRLMDEIRKLDYKFVILDTPPLFSVVDGFILSKYSDGIVLVISSGQADDEILKNIKKQIDQFKLPLLGVVINRIEPTKRGYYRIYKYYHRYGYYYHKGNNREIDGEIKFLESIKINQNGDL